MDYLNNPCFATGAVGFLLGIALIVLVDRIL